MDDPMEWARGRYKFTKEHLSKIILDDGTHRVLTIVFK